MLGTRCTKKFRLNGRWLARRSSWIWSRVVCVGNVAQPIEPSAPALETAATNAGALKPLIGAWMIGWVMPSRSRRSVRGHISLSPSHLPTADATLPPARPNAYRCDDCLLRAVANGFSQRHSPAMVRYAAEVCAILPHDRNEHDDCDRRRGGDADQTRH